MRQSPGPPGGLPVPQLTFELNAGWNCVKIGVSIDPDKVVFQIILKDLKKTNKYVYLCTEDNLWL